MELENFGPFLKGSLGWTKMKCGNKRCRCARGELHTACYLSYRRGNKTCTLHIPKPLADEVAKACRNWQKMKKVLEKHTHETITKWLRQYRQGQKNT